MLGVGLSSLTLRLYINIDLLWCQVIILIFFKYFFVDVDGLHLGFSTADHPDVNLGGTKKEAFANYLFPNFSVMFDLTLIQWGVAITRSLSQPTGYHVHLTSVMTLLQPLTIRSKTIKEWNKDYDLDWKKALFILRLYINIYYLYCQVFFYKKFLFL